MSLLIYLLNFPTLRTNLIEKGWAGLVISNLYVCPLYSVIRGSRVNPSGVKMY